MLNKNLLKIKTLLQHHSLPPNRETITEKIDWLDHTGILTYVYLKLIKKQNSKVNKNWENIDSIYDIWSFTH